jgi:hypothetical protein
VTAPKLEAPASENDLYLARGDEVPPWRPISTGDVFGEVPLSIGRDGPGLAIVLTHPCAMRTDGVRLVDRILVAPVHPANEVPFRQWSGHYRKLPLPNLEPGIHYAASFPGIEPVDSTTLHLEKRIAVFHPRGVNLLLQRLVHHMARVVVETDRFNVACAAAFAELDIIEDWVEAAVAVGIEADVASAACHTWIRGSDGAGLCPQDRLKEPQERAAVRRDGRMAARRWVAANTNS